MEFSDGLEDLSQDVLDTPELKKWPIDQKIGQGAFGDAFLVIDPKTRNRYVLKKVRMARQNEWQRAATRQEIKLGVMLSHPFIVRFCKSWIRDGHEVNIVYGYCEQGDLQTMMKKQKGKLLDEVQLRRWLAQLLLALHYMQTKNVLHRDLKSSNVFLTAENDVQVGDFGLATIRDEDDSASHDQSIVGTPHFMSPEVLNKKRYDYKTDVWSLGCVMYECTSFHPAFNAFNLNGLVSKICKAAVPPLPSQYSEQWGLLIKWMLRKDAAKRPSVEDLLCVSFLREDVAWACARARQISPGVQLPPFTASSLCSVEIPRTPTGGGAFVFEEGRAGGDEYHLRTPPRPSDQAEPGPGNLVVAAENQEVVMTAPTLISGAGGTGEGRKGEAWPTPKSEQHSGGEVSPAPNNKPAHRLTRKGSGPLTSTNERKAPTAPATRKTPTWSPQGSQLAGPLPHANRAVTQADADPASNLQPPDQNSAPAPAPASAVAIPGGSKRTRRSSFLNPTASSAIVSQAAAQRRLVRTTSASRRQPGGGATLTHSFRQAVAAPARGGHREASAAVAGGKRETPCEVAMLEIIKEGARAQSDAVTDGSGTVLSTDTHLTQVPQGGPAARPSGLASSRAILSKPRQSAPWRPSTGTSATAAAARRAIGQPAPRPAQRASRRVLTAAATSVAPTYRDATKAIGVARGAGVGASHLADADKADPPACRPRKAADNHLGTPGCQSGGSKRVGAGQQWVGPVSSRTMAQAEGDSPMSPAMHGLVGQGSSQAIISTDQSMSRLGQASLDSHKGQEQLYINELFQSPTVSCCEAAPELAQRSGLVPSDQRSGLVPSDQRSGLVPSDQRSGLVPSDQRSGLVPSDQRSGMVRSAAIGASEVELILGAALLPGPADSSGFSGFSALLGGSQPVYGALSDGNPTPTILIAAPTPDGDPMSLGTYNNIDFPACYSDTSPASGLSAVKPRALDLTGCALTPSHGDTGAAMTSEGGTPSHVVGTTPICMEVDSGSLGRWASGTTAQASPHVTLPSKWVHSPRWSQQTFGFPSDEIVIESPALTSQKQSSQVGPDRALLMERVIKLAVKLHAAGRWQELGNILSSVGQTHPTSESSGGAKEDGPGAPHPPHKSLRVGDKVVIPSQGQQGISRIGGDATIAYVGPCHWREARLEVVGLEFDHPAGGAHDGIVDGLVYFRCQPSHDVKKSVLVNLTRAFSDLVHVPLGHVHVHVIDGQLFAFGGDFETPCSYITVKSSASQITPEARRSISARITAILHEGFGIHPERTTTLFEELPVENIAVGTNIAEFSTGGSP